MSLMTYPRGILEYPLGGRRLYKGSSIPYTLITMQLMKGSAIEGLVGLLIFVALFCGLIGTFAAQFALTQNDTNITGGAKTMLGLGTLLVVAVFIMALVGIGFGYAKSRQVI
jgi:hypothetical protein